MGVGEVSYTVNFPRFGGQGSDDFAFFGVFGCHVVDDVDFVDDVIGEDSR